MGLAELPGIEYGGVELYVGLDFRVILGEDLSAVGMHFDTSCDPGASEGTIIGEPDVIELAGIVASGLNFAYKQQRVFCDPELFRLEIALAGPDNVRRLALPGVFAEFRKIVAFAFYDFDG